MSDNNNKNNNTGNNTNNNSGDHHQGTADDGLCLSKSKNSSNNNINCNNKSNIEKSVHPFDRISRYVFPAVYVLFLIGYFASYTRDL